MAKKFESINEAQLRFALELLRSQHSNDKSAVFSPASIATTVAMVYLGAQNETANQIRIAMGFTESEIHSYFSTLMKHTKNDYGVKVPPPEPEIDPNDTKALQERISELALLRNCNPYTSQCVLETINRIYVDDQTILKDNFVDKFDKFYQGGIEKVKFAEDKTVETDEDGTEAAAITVTVFLGYLSGGGPPPPPPIKFAADHPFIYFITDGRNNIYFCGTVTGAEFDKSDSILKEKLSNNPVTHFAKKLFLKKSSK
uniref:Serpin domain-containing protein n=1 Tax=Panagrolaimus davidi TaxID=227884 RepID=A0A914QJQ6_9BILA